MFDLFASKDFGKNWEFSELIFSETCRSGYLRSTLRELSRDQLGHECVLVEGVRRDVEGVVQS